VSVGESALKVNCDMQLERRRSLVALDR